MYSFVNTNKRIHLFEVAGIIVLNFELWVVALLLMHVCIVLKLVPALAIL